MVKLRKLIIETEGSAAPREIDAEEGCGGLGTEGNMGSEKAEKSPPRGQGRHHTSTSWQKVSDAELLPGYRC